MNESRTILFNRNLLSLLTARFLLTLATTMQATAVAWKIFELTKDPLSLGLIGLAEVLPAIGLSIFSGHFVDRYRRKNLALIAISIQLLSSSSLFLLSLPIHSLESDYLKLSIYASIFVSGMARSLMSPSVFALFGEMVPRDQMVKASAWNTTIWQVAASMGPAAGGLLYGYSGASLTFTVCLVCIVMAMISLSTIQMPSKPRITNVREPFMVSITAGLKFIFGNRLILSAISLDLFAVLFGGAVALFPFFADLLQVGPEGLGWMRAAPFIGAFCMAFFLTQYPPNRHSGKILLASVACYGLCILLFAYSRNFSFTLFILALSGAFDSVSVMTRGAILQLSTPDSMRGRVSAVNQVFISSSNELGAFESGMTAKWFGTIPSVYLGGLLTLSVVGIIAWFSPVLVKMNLSDLKNPQPQSPNDPA